jgi:hypothetical protein
MSKAMIIGAIGPATAGPKAVQLDRKGPSPLRTVDLTAL